MVPTFRARPTTVKLAPPPLGNVPTAQVSLFCTLVQLPTLALAETNDIPEGRFSINATLSAGAGPRLVTTNVVTTLAPTAALLEFAVAATAMSATEALGEADTGSEV